MMKTPKTSVEDDHLFPWKMNAYYHNRHHQLMDYPREKLLNVRQLAAAAAAPDVDAADEMTMSVWSTSYSSRRASFAFVVAPPPCILIPSRQLEISTTMRGCHCLP